MPTSLDIMLVVHALNGRAIADVVVTLAEEFVQLGHDVTVVATDVTETPSMVAGVPIIDLGGDGRSTTWSIPALARVIKQTRPDIVFAHANGPARAAVIAARLQGTRRPFVVTVEHNHFSSRRWSHYRLRRFANAAILPRADRVAAVSPSVAEDLQKTFPQLEGKLAVVPAPLTRWEHFEELALEEVDHPWFLGDTPVVTAVGNIVYRKDYETLLRAFASIPNQAVDDKPVRLAVIGRPDEETLDRELRDLARELGIDGCVAFLGFQANPLKFVARSAVFVNSSINEGAPIAILEALAIGVPVIATDCHGGSAWQLDYGNAGLVVPMGAPEALGEGIATLIMDDELRKALVSAGKRRVQRFSPRSVAEDYLRLVTKLQ